MNTNLRIGDVLKEKGYVTDEQMNQALAYQKEHLSLIHISEPTRP